MLSMNDAENNVMFIAWLLAGLSGLLFCMFLFLSWMWYLETAKGKARYSKAEAKIFLILIINTLMFRLNPGYGFILLPESEDDRGLVAISWITVILWTYLLSKALLIMIQEHRAGRHFKITKETFTTEIMHWGKRL